MEEIEKYSEDQLQNLTYRVLQQIAKSMSLPSNVKKVYLTQLIYAKLHKSAEEVQNIVDIVKYERQVLSMKNNAKKNRKRRNREQAMEVSSTNNRGRSPPIDMTPKRSTNQYSPNMTAQRPDVRYYSRRTQSPKNQSDRVLRSYSMKSTYRRPNYSLINNSVLEMVKAEKKDNQEKATQINIYSHQGKHQLLNLTARCVVKKCKPSLISSTCMETDSPTTTDQGHSQNNQALVPSKSKISNSGGLYVINRPEIKTTYEYAPSVGIRRTDGKIAKINAFVQKTAPNTYSERPAAKYTYAVNKSVLKQRGIKSVASIPYDRNPYQMVERPHVYLKPTPRYTYNLEKVAPNITYYPENYDIANVESGHMELTIQDIINSNIDAHTFANINLEHVLPDHSMNYPNLLLTDVLPTKRTVENGKKPFSVYYHRTVKAEHLRTPRPLPPLRSAFFKSQIARDVTQPLYIDTRDVSAQPVHTYPEYTCKNTPLLECLYTLRHGTLARESPLPPLPTTDTVTFTYATPTITTPVQQEITHRDASFLPPYSYEAVSQHQYVNASDEVSQTCDLVTTLKRYHETYEADSKHQYGDTSNEVSQSCDIVTHEQDMTLRRYHETYEADSQNQGVNTSEVSQSCDLVTHEQDVTFKDSDGTSDSSPYSDRPSSPETINDLLEVISQDGDYMERMGMEKKMHCVLCSWAGPKLLLESHVRQEHASQIIVQEKDEWNITYKLGMLVKQDIWLSHVCEWDNDLYVLSVKYEDPDCLMASISSLSAYVGPKIGTVTIYNKVTGEPYSWSDSVPDLHPKMPYRNHKKGNHLKIQLSKLELLPNSANLKLHNRSLVLNSPSKVVVGTPELNDIHIIIFVKIQDSLL